MTNWIEGKLLLCGKFECQGVQTQSSFAASSKEKLPSWILLLHVTGNSCWPQTWVKTWYLLWCQLCGI